MKLKEKLAWEAAKEHGYPESLLLYHVFLAGFEKARELASAKAHEMADIYNPRYYGAAMAIGELGEEEVK